MKRFLALIERASDMWNSNTIMKPGYVECPNTIDLTRRETSFATFSLEQIDQTDQQQAFDSMLTRCKGITMALVFAGRNVRIPAARCKEHKAKAWESYTKRGKVTQRSLINCLASILESRANRRVFVSSFPFL